MNISVIIPTYKRPGTLMRALRSLQEQTYVDFEVLTVDNAADPTVESLVASLNRTSKKPIRYLPEPRLGLHNARHAGARAARGDVLVFTDDDATFDACWLQAYADAFNKHLDMVAAGGPVRPFWEVPPPRWLVDFIGDAKIFGPLSLMEPHGDFELSAEGFFWGVNMAIRRDALWAVGGFNPELLGEFTIGDGESGLCRKIRERGWLIGYVPEALVYHHIPPSRMTVEYLCRWQAHLAGALLYSRYHRAMAGPLGLVADAVKIALSFACVWVETGLKRYRTDQRSISKQVQAALGYAQIRYILRLVCDRRLRRMVVHRDWLKSGP